MTKKNGTRLAALLEQVHGHALKSATEPRQVDVLERALELFLKDQLGGCMVGPSPEERVRSASQEFKSRQVHQSSKQEKELFLQTPIDQLLLSEGAGLVCRACGITTVRQLISMSCEELHRVYRRARPGQKIHGMTYKHLKGLLRNHELRLGMREEDINSWLAS